jgi:hypothetical protein
MALGGVHVSPDIMAAIDNGTPAEEFARADQADRVTAYDVHQIAKNIGRR